MGILLRVPQRATTQVGGLNERSLRGISGALLERPDARLVFGAGHPVAALVRGCRRAHKYPLLPLATGRALAAGSLGPGVHHHQPLSDRAHLPGTTPGGALPRRAAPLRHGISLAPAARVRVADARGRVEGWRRRQQDTDRRAAGRIDLHRDLWHAGGPPTGRISDDA